MILQQHGLVLECVGNDAIESKRGIAKESSEISPVPFDVLLSAVYKGKNGEKHVLDVEGFDIIFTGAKDLLTLLHHALNM